MSAISVHTIGTIKAKLDHQLSIIRTEKKNNYHSTSTDETYATSSHITEDKSSHTWPKNTLLIASDSIMNNIDENRLNRSDINVKVRAFSGSTVTDMYDYIKPLLKKQPTHLLLHVCSNDAPFKSSNQILDELLLLKRYIENSVQGINVIISKPLLRIDNPKARITLDRVSTKLENLNISTLDNSNITDIHLGRKGLHLNRRGNGRLALNLMSLIREL